MIKLAVNTDAKRDEACSIPPSRAKVTSPTGREQRLASMLWIGLLIGIEAWIVGWYGLTFASMADIWWRSDTFAHGLIVYPMCIWLALGKRAELSRVPIAPSAIALLPLAGAGFGWLVASAGGVQAGQHVCLVALIAFAPWAVLGTAAARVLLFPLTFTVFAAPIGEFLMPVMMQHTADFTVAALRVSGVPVYREGLNFVIPSGRWSVVEACSGLRYLIASVMLGCLFAYLNYRSPWRRAAFVVVSFVTPVVANWLRAYMIVMLGHLSGNTLAVGVDHLIYGWVFFGIVMLAMFMIGSIWREGGNRLASREAEFRPVARAVPGTRAIAMVMLAALVVAIWPSYSEMLDDALKPREIVLIAPSGADGWSHVAGEPAPFRPRYGGSRAQLADTYARGQDRATLYVGYYASQTEGRELINFNNTIVPSKDPEWSRTREGLVVAIPGVLRAQETRLSRSGQSLTVWHWYWVNGQWTESREHGKILHAIARLTGRGDDAAIVAIYTMREGDERDQSAEKLSAFARAMLPGVESALNQARAAARSSAVGAAPVQSTYPGPGS